MTTGDVAGVQLPSVPSRIERIAFWGVAAMALAWAVVSLAWPLAESQGMFAWVGDVIRRGGMPYADAWEMRGPFPFYVFAAALTVFGTSEWAIRVLDLAFVALGAWGIARVVAHLASRTAAQWAAVIFVLWYGSMTFAETAQPDGWVGMMAAAAIGPLVAAEDRFRTRHLVVAGVLLSLCALNKPFYIGFALVPVLHIAAHRGLAVRRLLAPVLVFGVAFLAPILLTVAWFAARGALDDLIAVHLQYSSAAYAKVGTLAIGHRVLGVVEYLWRGKIIAISLVPIALGVVALWRTNRAALLVIASWLALGVAFVALQNQFFAYHWLPTVPPAVVLGAVGIHSLISRTATSASTTRAAGYPTLAAAFLLGVVVFHVTIRPLFYLAQWAQVRTGRMSQEQYYDELNSTYGGTVRPTEVIEGARYLRSKTSADDRVMILSNESAILVLADRQASSRFGGWGGPLLTNPGSRFFEPYRREQMDTLRKAPPRYVILNRDITRYPPGQQVDDFPEFAGFLQTHYRLETTIGDLQLYRRDDASFPR